MLKPMLASNECITLDELNTLNYPFLVSDKEDGIRCKTGIDTERNCVAGFSRELLLLPNCQVQAALEHAGVGFDGEIVIPGWPFNEIQSKVMTNVTVPFIWEYLLFDCEPDNDQSTFVNRLRKLEHRFHRYGIDQMRILKQTQVKNAIQLSVAFEDAIERGKEGLILKSPTSVWKEGRCTRKEQIMLKMKQYEDAEAIVIGFVEEQQNLNQATESETGRSKRSSHKANKKGKGRLGALICKDCKTGVIFNLGSGFTAKDRQEIWDDRPVFLDERVTYKSAIFGVKDKPRTPIWKGFRYD